MLLMVKLRRMKLKKKEKRRIIRIKVKVKRKIMVQLKMFQRKKSIKEHLVLSFQTLNWLTWRSVTLDSIPMSSFGRWIATEHNLENQHCLKDSINTFKELLMQVLFRDKNSFRWSHHFFLMLNQTMLSLTCALHLDLKLHNFLSSCMRKEVLTPKELLSLTMLTRKEHTCWPIKCVESIRLD